MSGVNFNSNLLEPYKNPQKSQQTKHNGFNFLQWSGAFCAGKATQLLIDSTYSCMSAPFINKGLYNPPIKEANIETALNDALTKTGLKTKGIEFIKAIPRPKPLQFNDIFTNNGVEIPINEQIKKGEEFIKNDEILKHLIVQNKKPNKFKVFINKLNPLRKFNELKVEKKLINIGESFREGLNAAFLPQKNKICINPERIGYAGFHEMGHALNYHNSKFWKHIQLMNKGPKRIALAIALVALMTNKHNEDNPPKNIWQKSTNFIKDNAGILTFLTFLPKVSEELVASIKGKQIAKKVLAPEFLKHVTRNNVAGFLSYLGIAIFTSIGIQVATKVRDKVAEKFVAKNNNK